MQPLWGIINIFGLALQLHAKLSTDKLHTFGLCCAATACPSACPLAFLRTGSISASQARWSATLAHGCLAHGHLAHGHLVHGHLAHCLVHGHLAHGLSCSWPPSCRLASNLSQPHQFCTYKFSLILNILLYFILHPSSKLCSSMIALHIINISSSSCSLKANA